MSRRAGFRLLTGEQKKPKRTKTRVSFPLLTGEQGEDLKKICPLPDKGFWFETVADGRGYKIKLKWREEGRQKCFVFSRVGKWELETLRKGTQDEQRTDLADRLIGELHQKERPDLAARIKTKTEDNLESGLTNSKLIERSTNKRVG